jgi:hypothetical protein
LNIHTEEDVIKFKEFIIDEFKLKSYFNFLSLFKNDKYISEKIDNLDDSSYKIKIIKNVNNKVFLIRKLEKQYNIAPFHINFNDNNDAVQFDIKLFELLKIVFRTEKNKPATKHEIIKMYISLLKNVFGNLELIKTGKTTDKHNKTVYNYIFDLERIKFIFDLVGLNTSNFKNMDASLLQFFNVVKPVASIDSFDNEMYQFGKLKKHS